jgi:phosphatidyl-myo-inositol dimannoside synthase
MHATILALIPDTFHGFGGIAQYNRDLLTALADDPAVGAIHCLPRNGAGAAAIPHPKISEQGERSGTARYALRARSAAQRLAPDLLLCGHLHFLPLAAYLARRRRIPLLLELYGIEAWEARDRFRRDAASVTLALSISRCTRRRFLRWFPVQPSAVAVLPNAVHEAPRRDDARVARVVERYGLQNRRVLLTVSRLAASERYKGHDRVLAQLPALAGEFPDLTYLIVGDGDDRARLEQRARDAGIADRVIFTGRLSDDDRAACYDAAHAFAMPSTGEGFGFVFLEAAAHGLPVLGGATDGSIDALRDGALGLAVDPGNPEALRHGLIELLRRPRQTNPQVEAFAWPRFAEHARALLRPLL